jgi:hypothetical protein
MLAMLSLALVAAQTAGTVTEAEATPIKAGWDWIFQQIPDGFLDRQLHIDSKTLKVTFELRFIPQVFDR